MKCRKNSEEMVSDLQQLLSCELTLLFLFSDLRDIDALISMKLSFKKGFIMHVIPPTCQLLCISFCSSYAFFLRAWSQEDWQVWNVVFWPNRHSKCWLDVFLPLPPSTVLNSPSTHSIEKPPLILNIALHRNSFQCAGQIHFTLHFRMCHSC